MNFPKFKAYLKKLKPEGNTLWKDQVGKIHDVNTINFQFETIQLVPHCDRGYYYITVDFDQVIIFQWTGITDSNGKEIYGGFNKGEGDIVYIELQVQTKMKVKDKEPIEMSYKTEKRIGIVVWHDELAGWVITDTNGLYYEEYPLMKPCNEFNITKLGNSLTNPELLKKEI